MKNDETIMTVVGWFFNPQITVASTDTSLANNFVGLDSVSRVGGRSSNNTSWNCISRSYVGSVRIKQAAAEVGLGRPDDVVPIEDVPTQTEINGFSMAEKQLYEKGMKLFFRRRGLLSRRQVAELPPYAVVPAVDAAVRVEGPADRVSAVAPAVVDANLGYYYTKYVPVRSFSVDSEFCPRETDPMPIFQPLASRLSEAAQTGVLSAVSKGPNTRDSQSMTSLVKSLVHYPTTRFQIAAILRSVAIMMSVCGECYQTDPIVGRFVHSALSHEYTGCAIYQKPGAMDGWKITAMPLDVFVGVANNTFQDGVPPGFGYQGLDNEWTAVPVSS